MNFRLDIFGPYPPPFGGISTHIQRIQHFLEEEKIDYLIFNHGSAAGNRVIPTNKSPWWYIRYLFGTKGRVIHFHQFLKFHYLYFFVLSLFSRSKLIVTIHEENLLHYPSLAQRIVIKLLKHTNFISLISVSQKLQAFLASHGIESTWLPAYVPAMNVTFKSVKPPDKKPFFVYSVWKLDRDISERIYNIRLAFKLLRQLKPSYNMLFLVGTEAESDKAFLNELLNEFGVQNAVVTLYEAQLTDYVKNGRFLLRTNAMDGFGVSLQEAIDQGVPAIASDVCLRPEGTILFKNGDFDDLMEKVSKLRPNSLPFMQPPRYHTVLLDLYKQNLTT